MSIKLRLIDMINEFGGSISLNEVADWYGEEAAQQMQAAHDLVNISEDGIVTLKESTKVDEN